MGSGFLERGIWAGMEGLFWNCSWKLLFLDKPEGTLDRVAIVSLYFQAWHHTWQTAGTQYMFVRWINDGRKKRVGETVAQQSQTQTFLFYPGTLQSPERPQVLKKKKKRPHILESEKPGFRSSSTPFWKSGGATWQLKMSVLSSSCPWGHRGGAQQVIDLVFVNTTRGRTWP